MNREKIQEIALQKAEENNYNGVLVLTPGSGKSKVAIDCIKQGNFKNILITSPRTNLKSNWLEEIKKWFNKPCNRLDDPIKQIESYITLHIDGTIQTLENNFITLENIQTCYKWNIEKIREFDFIIVDEVHTIGEEYFNLIYNAQYLEPFVPILGLTGTPTLSDPWKKDVLYKALPIIYEYYNAEEDGITNKIQYWKYEYELTDNYKVVAGTKTKKWYVGEAKQYAYLSEQYEKAKKLMFEQGATDYFNQAIEWMGKKQNGNFEITKEMAEAGRKFFFAIKARKDFLWNLSSSKAIALYIKNLILNPYVKEKTLNKVLLFSELTQQAEKLSPYSIHSNNGKNAKEAEIINKELLNKFNSGELRELSSCLSLTLGLNMTGASYAVFESYSSSVTNFIQKSKRLARLDKDKTAHVIVIVPKGTQAETWSNELLKDLDYITITDLNDLKI